MYVDYDVDRPTARLQGGRTWSIWFCITSLMMPYSSKYPPLPSVPKGSLKQICTGNCPSDAALVRLALQRRKCSRHTKQVRSRCHHTILDVHEQRNPIAVPELTMADLLSTDATMQTDTRSVTRTATLEGKALASRACVCYSWQVGLQLIVANASCTVSHAQRLQAAHLSAQQRLRQQ